MATLAQARVVEIDELPDGRQLLLYEDGRSIVTGRATRRPHPVPGWEWLGAHPHQSSTPRLRQQSQPRRHRAPSSRGDGGRVIAPRVVGAHKDSAAYRRAAALLESLLDPVQLGDYRTSGTFWVPTARGPVRLGQLYALVHHPSDQPSTERVLCVVPDRHRDLPLPDIWTNLLLTLAVEPDEFFRVAVERQVRPRLGPGSPFNNPLSRSTRAWGSDVPHSILNGRVVQPPIAFDRDIDVIERRHVVRVP